MKTIYKKLLFLLLLLPVTVLAQSSLEGVVLDSKSKQPIPGVNVVIQGASTGASTDFDGRFKLSNVKNGDKVVFSFIGYTSQTINFNGQKSISVALVEEANLLQEVVVQVGYGTVKKKDATGSVTTVTSKDFVKGPVVSADQMIQGKVAGVQITNGGGAPGEGSTIRVRQGSSFINNDPLYVIDNVPVANDNTGGRNVLATINQNDIESVTVLKDASATAIYGSRASNGVIIITTKKGKSGDLKVTYNGNVSVSEIGNQVDNLSASQFRDYVTTFGSANQQSVLGDASTNWQNEIYRKALGTDHNVALSGGVDNINYRVSVGLTDMNGILKRDNMNRATTAVALIGNFFDNHLKIEVNNKTSVMKNNYSNRGAIGSAVTFDPTQSIRNDDGTYFEWNDQLAGRNPVALLNQFNNFGTNVRSLGNVQTEYKLHFFPDLKLVANLGYDYTTGRSYGSSNPDYAYDVTDSYETKNFSKNRLMDLFFNYKKDIKAFKGSVELTAGYNYQNFQYFGGGFSVNNAITAPNNPYFNELNLQSFFGRAIVNFYDKYILTATYRRDGSSRFTEDLRWGNFPSAALAWKLDEEDFVKNVGAISNLKLRLGWGLTGQQDIGRFYPSLPVYLLSDAQAQYQFGNQFYSTVRPEPTNPNLKWEETETRNLGLDFGFLKNRISGSVDVYEKRSVDILANSVNLPPFFGFSNVGPYNIGKTKSQGIEISAEVIPVKNENFTFAIGGNVTFQNSEITGLVDGAPNYGIETGGIAGGVGNNIQVLSVGNALNSFFVYEQAYDNTGQPIDGVFIDRNGDGAITTADRYIYKKPNSDIYYGFYTNLSYKNWDLAMSWRGSWGNYVYNNVDSNLGWSNQVLIRETDLSNAVSEILNTNFSSTTTERLQSDYYIQDASYIRLDNVTIGYNFKKFMSENVSARLSFAGQNLFLITDYKGIDPEVSGGIDNNIYPRPRIFTVGLNVNF